MTASPLVEVQYSSDAGNWHDTPGGIDVSPGDTVQIRLLTPFGASKWFLKIFGVDELTATPPNLTGVSGGQVDTTSTVVTFTMPAGAGVALVFKSTVDSGGAGLVDTFGIYTLTNDGFRVGAVGERLEGDPEFGWIRTVNTFIRVGGGTGAQGRQGRQGGQGYQGNVGTGAQGWQGNQGNDATGVQGNQGWQGSGSGGGTSLIFVAGVSAQASGTPTRMGSREATNSTTMTFMVQLEATAGTAHAQLYDNTALASVVDLTTTNTTTTRLTASGLSIISGHVYELQVWLVGGNPAIDKAIITYGELS